MRGHIAYKSAHSRHMLNPVALEPLIISCYDADGAGEGLDEACASILSQRMGRDVYIIGAANVGKSAFVRRMLKEMANMTSRHFGAKATLVGKKLPVESAMPGTTLGLLQLGAFSSGGSLYDTPGQPLLTALYFMPSPALIGTAGVQ